MRVALACTDDPRPAVRSLLAHVSDPTTIRLAVATAAGPDVTADLHALAGALGGVHIVSPDASDARPGSDIPRLLTLGDGASHVLVADHRVRFTGGWQEALLSQWASARGRHVALTGFLPMDGAGEDPQPSSRLAITGAWPAIGLVAMPVPRQNMAPLELTPFLAPDFVFASSAVWALAPFEPMVPGSLQRLDAAIRFWTHGVDVFQPRDAPLRVAAAVGGPEAGAEGGLDCARRFGLVAGESPDASAAQAGYGSVRRVADFWVAAGVDVARGRVAQASREGRWRREPPRPDPPRIFVNIPSYRDRETQATVEDALAQADRPERIVFGICWQYLPGEEGTCITGPLAASGQVRVVEVPAAEGRGAMWARAQAWSLRQDEPYVLSIDAHMRFETGWDETLLDMLSRCPGPKAVLSTYPLRYTADGWRDRDSGIYRMTFRDFVDDEPGMPPKLFYQTTRIAPDRWPDRPYPTATVGQGFIFARSELFDEVPFDPHVYFFGDDLSIATRAWTAGWDLYSPHRPVLFHLWDRDARPNHWKDLPAAAARLRRITQRRVAHLVGIETTADPEALQELDVYGLGTARSLADYAAFSGVDFQRRTVSERARRGEVNLPGDPPEPTRQAPRSHRGRIVMRTAEAVVIDDFLSEADYEAVRAHAAAIDYRYINVQGNVRRVWDLGNGFPLRSDKDLFVHAPHAPAREGSFHHPSGTPLDRFADAIVDAMQEVGSLVGHPEPRGWNHFSVTSWLYPPGTGLSLHDDGAGVYSGAYVYYLNPTWRPHWGGLLMLLDGATNRAIADRVAGPEAAEFRAKKWLHMGGLDELAMESGLAQCVLPRRNRMVFIAPDAYHFVTKVLPEAGDEVRMSLAGFFHRRPSKASSSG